MKTYLFRAELEQDEDGRWSAWIEALPGCAAWGRTKQEALAALRGAAEAYVADMVETGDALPQQGVQVVEAPVVTVAV